MFERVLVYVVLFNFLTSKNVQYTYRIPGTSQLFSYLGYLSSLEAHPEIKNAHPEIFPKRAGASVSEKTVQKPV